MASDGTPKPPRFTREQIELAALLLGLLASAFVIADGIVRFIAWMIHG